MTNGGLMFKTMTLLAALVLVFGACGSEGGDGGGSAAGSSDGGHDMSTMDESGDDGAGFGKAAEAGDADRTIDVETLDELRFDPEEIRVEVGETINFVVTNDGRAPHEFVIGDEEYQAEHEQGMEHGGHGESTGNVIEVDPGDTAEIAWTFSEPGEVLYACHVEGHYEGGMVGTVRVDEG